jgi:D-aminopeptidase
MTYRASLLTALLAVGCAPPFAALLAVGCAPPTRVAPPAGARGAPATARPNAALAADGAAARVAPPAPGDQPPALAPGRARARDLGVAPGIFRPGPYNAITDVAGVRVGQVTIVEGDAVRTGVTAVLPHGGDLFRERVPAALFVGNGYGKLLGATQLRELGELETPVLLTCTLCVWKAADAMVAWLLERPGMADVRSINPVVGETNDGRLNAIRERPVGAEHVRRALESARGGPVAEGSVGAGTGTVAFGWKGGIGTASRVLPPSLGAHSVGVLVQTNFGGVLQVLGAPVGRELGRYAFRDDVEPRGARGGRGAGDDEGRGDGSVMIVVATDAPLGDRNLGRLAARAMMGLARTGSAASNGSGDYAIAFSTAEGVRRRAGGPAAGARGELTNDELSPLFQAVVEATEEAIYDSLFAATTVAGGGRTVEAISLDRVRDVLRKYNVGGR